MIFQGPIPTSLHDCASLSTSGLRWIVTVIAYAVFLVEASVTYSTVRSLFKRNQFSAKYCPLWLQTDRHVIRRPALRVPQRLSAVAVRMAQVRRGLRTKDEKEAGQFLAKLNQLLSDRIL